jgi:DegV family protein with EDD domain
MDLDAGNTAIVLDSTADFPAASQRFPSWRVVPLYVNFGAVSYRDEVELPAEAFYARLATASEPPTTSQPTPADFLAVYEELAERYERILSLQISATLSGTFASAQSAAASLGGRVHVVDTGTVSAAVTMLGLAVQRRLERGTSDEEIAALVDRYRSTHGLLFTVETLEYLARGGRIGRAAAFAGTLLNVKPILSLRQGEVVPLKRVRGSKQALEEFGALLEAGSTDSPGLRLGIAHAAAPDRAVALERVVRAVRPHGELEVVTSLGAVVGTHAGPGALGLFWFDDPD